MSSAILEIFTFWARTLTFLACLVAPGLFHLSCICPLYSMKTRPLYFPPWGQFLISCSKYFPAKVNTPQLVIAPQLVHPILTVHAMWNDLLVIIHIILPFSFVTSQRGAKMAEVLGYSMSYGMDTGQTISDLYGNLGSLILCF